jgi:hypothetical protein
MAGKPCWDELPPEILTSVAHIIYVEHRPSLWSFTCVSRAFHQAALSSVSHTITFKISGPRRLQKDVERLTRILTTQDGFRYVRSINVEGYMSDQEAEDEAAAEWALDNNNYYGEDEIYGSDYDNNYVLGQDDHPGVSDEEDQRWKPLASFLRDVYWRQYILIKNNVKLTSRISGLRAYKKM